MFPELMQKLIAEMESKILFSLLLVLVAGANAHSFRGAKETPCDASYGELVSPTICQVAKTLIAGIDDPLAAADIVVDDLSTIDPELTGTIELSNIVIKGIPKITIDSCSMATATATAPLAVDLGITVVHLEFSAHHKTNAVSATAGPLVGEGSISFVAELSVHANVDVTFCPYENPMKTEKVDYTVELISPLQVTLDGVQEGESFINDLIAKLENPETFPEVEQEYHQGVINVIKRVADPLLQNYTPCQFLGCEAK